MSLLRKRYVAFLTALVLTALVVLPATAGAVIYVENSVQPVSSAQ